MLYYSTYLAYVQNTKLNPTKVAKLLTIYDKAGEDFTFGTEKSIVH